MKKYEVEKFCDDVSISCEESFRSFTNKMPIITPEQVIEAIGGISNLYLEKLIERKSKEMTFKTHSTFASRELKIKKSEVIKEISNCSGVSLERSKTLLENMQNNFAKKFMALQDRNSKEPIMLEPLGIFRINNLAAQKYLVHYADPAANNYKNFLLSKEE
jgi:hypothetical protein